MGKQADRTRRNLALQADPVYQANGHRIPAIPMGKRLPGAPPDPPPPLTAEQVIDAVAMFGRNDALAVLRAALARLTGERLFTEHEVDALVRQAVEQALQIARHQQAARQPGGPCKRTASGLLIAE